MSYFEDGAELEDEYFEDEFEAALELLEKGKDSAIDQFILDHAVDDFSFDMEYASLDAPEFNPVPGEHDSSFPSRQPGGRSISDSRQKSRMLSRGLKYSASLHFSKRKPAGGISILPPDKVPKDTVDRTALAVVYIKDSLHSRDFVLHNTTALARKANRILESVFYRSFVILMAFLHLGMITLEPPSSRQRQDPSYKDSLLAILLAQTFFLCVYVTDVALHYFDVGKEGFSPRMTSLAAFWKTLHVWPLLQVTLIVALAADILSGLIGGTSLYYSFTRPLRPAFLLFFFPKIRRAVVLLLTAVTRNANVGLLILVLVAVFANVGVVLFGETGVYQNTQYSGKEDFSNFPAACLTLFLMLTRKGTSYVMFPAIQASRVYTLFFVLFLFTGVYLLVTVILAVVFDFYKARRRQKVVELRVNTRKALMAAFQLLDNNADGRVDFEDWVGVLAFFHPDPARLQEVRTVFNYLLGGKTTSLGVMQFFKVCDVLAMKLQRVQSRQLCPSKLVKWHTRCFSSKRVRSVLESPKLEAAVAMLIAACGVVVSLQQTKTMTENDLKILDIIYQTCLLVFALETLLRLLATPGQFMSSTWDRVDAGILFFVCVAEMVFFVQPTWYAEVHVLRSVGMVRVLTRVKRFQVFIETIGSVLLRILPVAAVLLLFGYTFAAIGMELFASRLPKVGITSILHFDSFLAAMLTLFQLLTCSGWPDLLAVVARVVAPSSVWYFIIFCILVVIIVTNLLVALFLEGFNEKVTRAAQGKGSSKELIIALTEEDGVKSTGNFYKIHLEAWDMDMQVAHEKELSVLAKETGVDMDEDGRENSGLESLHNAINLKRKGSLLPQPRGEELIDNNGAAENKGGIRFLTAEDIQNAQQMDTQTVVQAYPMLPPAHGPVSTCGWPYGVRVLVDCGPNVLFVLTTGKDAPDSFAVFECDAEDTFTVPHGADVIKLSTTISVGNACKVFLSMVSPDFLASMGNVHYLTPEASRDDVPPQHHHLALATIVPRKVFLPPPLEEKQDDEESSVASEAGCNGYDGQLVIEVMEGTNLIACDSNGCSDPYVKVVPNASGSIVPPVVKTKIINKTLNPKWNETLVMNINGVTSVRLVLRDYDKIGKGSPMGYADVHIVDLLDQERHDISLHLLPDDVSLPKELGQLRIAVRFVDISPVEILEETYLPPAANFFDVIRNSSPATCIIYRFEDTTKRRRPSVQKSSKPQQEDGSGSAKDTVPEAELSASRASSPHSRFIAMGGTSDPLLVLADDGVAKSSHSAEVPGHRRSISAIAKDREVSKVKDHAEAPAPSAAVLSLSTSVSLPPTPVPFSQATALKSLPVPYKLRGQEGRADSAPPRQLAPFTPHTREVSPLLSGIDERRLLQMGPAFSRAYDMLLANQALEAQTSEDGEDVDTTKVLSSEGKESSFLSDSSDPGSGFAGPLRDVPSAARKPSVSWALSVSSQGEVSSQGVVAPGGEDAGTSKASSMPSAFVVAQLGRSAVMHDSLDEESLGNFSTGTFEKVAAHVASPELEVSTAEADVQAQPPIEAEPLQNHPVEEATGSDRDGAVHVMNSSSTSNATSEDMEALIAEAGRIHLSTE